MPIVNLIRQQPTRSSTLSAVELVRKFGISYQTLNHYTNLGLLRDSGRQGLKRLYRADSVKKRLRTIKALQNKGYTLRLIARRLNSRRGAP